MSYVYKFECCYCTKGFNTFIQQSLNVEGLPFIVTKNSKEALKEQAIAMLMLDLKRTEKRANAEGWIDADFRIVGDTPDPMPNIVFSGTVAAPETSTIYQKYIHPIAGCDLLPFIVFRHDNSQFDEVNQIIDDIYCAMREQADCYEMIVQRNISCIFEYIFQNCW